MSKEGSNINPLFWIIQNHNGKHSPEETLVRNLSMPFWNLMPILLLLLTILNEFNINIMIFVGINLILSLTATQTQNLIVSFMSLTLSSALLWVVMLYNFDGTFACLIYSFLLTQLVFICTMNSKLFISYNMFHILVYLTGVQELESIQFTFKNPSHILKVTGGYLLIMYIILTLLFGGLIYTIKMLKRKIDCYNQLLTNNSEEHKNFISQFSHELRNPINSLIGNLQLICSEKLYSEASNLISNAKICAEIILHLLNNILDKDKIEEDKLHIHITPTDMHSLATRVWRMYEEQIKARKIHGILRVENKIPNMLLLDPFRINQILINLLTNATKFTVKGNISLSLQWLEEVEVTKKCFEPLPYNEEDEGIFEKNEKIAVMKLNSRLDSMDHLITQSKEKNNKNVNKNNNKEKSTQGILKIVVSDTGPGMDTNSLEALFKKYSQVSDSPMHRQIGSGLGLYITEELVNRMNGSIKVYSKVGAGTTFITCIPTSSVVVENQNNNIEEKLVQALAKKQIYILVGGKSSSFISKCLSMIEGSICSTRDNGYDVYKMYTECIRSSRKVHAIILESNMRLVNGVLTYKMIRKFEKDNKLNAVDILILKSHEVGSPKNLDDEIDYNNDLNIAYINKPLSFQSLIRGLYDIIP